MLICTNHDAQEVVSPRAAVPMILIDSNDGVFRFAVTHLDDKISDQPPLQNLEMDGLACA